MRVIVVGGGIAGLAAAARLVDEGHRVTLVEKRPTLGGRAYSVVDDETGDTVDNGQHLLMGCYRAVRGFLRRIGAEQGLRLQRDLRVTLVDEGRTRRLKAAHLPAPLHLLAGVAGFSALTVGDRLRLLKVAAAIARPSAMFPQASDFETIERWLDRVGQSAQARRAFWHPLALATLNEDPPRASARMLEAVLAEAFFGPAREDAVLALPRVGLTQLYAEPAARHIEAHGGRILTAAPVAELRLRGRTIAGVALRDGTVLEADAVILAVPPRAALALEPAGLPSGETYFRAIARLESSPIVSVHLWLDRLVTDEELLGLCGRPMHWIFHRNQLTEVRDPSRSHVSLVTSAARELVDADADTIVRLAMEELGRALPRARQARLLRHRVWKEREATIAHLAGTESFRPGVRSPVEGLWLAGDWVRTGLPATLESAVRAADAACAQLAAWEPAPPPSPRPDLVPASRLSRVSSRT